MNHDETEWTELRACDLRVHGFVREKQSPKTVPPKQRRRGWDWEKQRPRQNNADVDPM